MLAGMGYATWTDAFVAARRDHVVDVLMALLAATPSGERAAPARRPRRGA
jgi:hypothetical protein